MTAPLPQGASVILVIAPTWLGDLVMATPVCRAIRARRPDARIVLAVRAGHEAVAESAAWCDEIITIAPAGVMGPIRAARTIRAQAPDAILLLPNSARSALVARLSGATIRIGYGRDGRGILLTDALPGKRPTAPVSTVEDYARLGAFALGVDDDAIERRLDLAPTDAGRRAAAEIVGDADLLVLLVPGGSKGPKLWPAERFGALGRALVETHGARVAVSGAPSERSLTASIATAIGGDAIDLAARGAGLGTVMALIERAAVVITNDTGPRHLAAALGTPSVVLFGPTDHRWTELPSATEHLLRAEPFLPGELVADRHPGACSIDRIPLSDVLHATRRLLPATLAARL